MKKNIYLNVSSLDDVFLFYLDGEISTENIGLFLKKLGSEKINIDVISLNISSQTEDKINFSANYMDRDNIFNILDSMNINFGYKDNVSKVTIAGDIMRTEAGIAARAFGALIDSSIPFYQVSTSDISISYIIDKEKKSEAVKALENEFNLE